jgi:hypothetical protein
MLHFSECIVTKTLGSKIKMSWGRKTDKGRKKSSFTNFYSNMLYLNFGIGPKVHII